MLENIKQVVVRMFTKEMRILILGLILMAPLLNYGQVTFTEVPIDKQLYARDSYNKGYVVFDGEYSDLEAGNPTYTSIRIDVRRKNSQGVETFYKSVTQNISYTNNSADFLFNISIDAEMASFNFQLFGELGSNDDLLYSVEDIVAGDVYVIQGQSNAEALKQPQETLNVSSYESDFIRVFGSSTKQSDKFVDPLHPDYSVNHTVWNYGKGNFSSGGIPAGIGQWGIIFAKSIVDIHQIPVAIFNGATGGKSIDYFQVNYDNSFERNENDLNSYQRLIWRLDQTNLKDKVKAIIWSQGEADASLNTSISSYMNQFQTLLDSWNGDFNGLLSKFYIFQTKSSCGTANSMKVKEAQRRLADENTAIKIIQTTGLSYINDCHFSVTDGYEKFASRIYAHISADFYGGTDNESIYTPTLVRSYLRGPTTLVLETMATETMTSNLTNNNIDLADFELNSSNSVTITNISIDPIEKGNIIFELSGNPSGTVTITYLGRGFGVSNNTTNLIVNSGGIELVCFSEYPVDTSLETIWSDGKWSLIDPVSTMDAVINGTYPISKGGFEARNLTINNGQNVNFDSGSIGNENIILFGDLYISPNASLTIGDSESFIMKDVLANVTLQGNARFIKKEKSTELETPYDVTYWGSSVEGETLGSVFPNVDPNRIFEYIPTEENSIYTGAYEKYKHWFVANGNMIPGKGYSVDGDSEPGNPTYPRFSEIEFEGIPNYKDISIQINKFSTGILTYDQSNLLANPYPASIDPDVLIDENQDVFKGTIYIWTHSSEYTSGEYEYDYVTYNKSGSGSSHIQGEYHIASGQGFMILTDETNAIFNFRNSMMVAGKNTDFYKSKTKKNEIQDEKDRVWINLSSEESNQDKEVLVAFFDYTTEEFDVGFDGELLNTEADLTFYSLIDKEKYAIQALSKVNLKQNRGLSLGFSASKMGNYSIGVSRYEGQLSNQNIYLIDKQLHIVHNLRKQDYSFNLESSGEFNNRFSLLFEEMRFFRDSLIEETKIIVLIRNQELVLESEKEVEEIRIYDYLGRLLVEGKPFNNVLSIENETVPYRSVLFSQIYFKDGSMCKKKIVRLN